VKGGGTDGPRTISSIWASTASIYQGVELAFNFGVGKSAEEFRHARIGDDYISPR
jgi:hypothetical protein